MSWWRQCRQGGKRVNRSPHFYFVCFFLPPGADRFHATLIIVAHARLTRLNWWRNEEETPFNMSNYNPLVVVAAIWLFSFNSFRNGIDGYSTAINSGKSSLIWWFKYQLMFDVFKKMWRAMATKRTTSTKLSEANWSAGETTNTWLILIFNWLLI